MVDEEEVDTWPNADFGSPFSTAAEDLARYYFYNYWVAEGKFPPLTGWHDRLHQTSWMSSSACPGMERLAELHYLYRQRIC